jgi:hypothetical protein
MRISIARVARIASIASIAPIALLLAAACGPAPKPEGPIVPETTVVPDTCCCKSTPIASPDGLPIYEAGHNRMECSTKQGTCVDEVQCQGRAQDGSDGSASGLSPDSMVPDPPALPND